MSKFHRRSTIFYESRVPAWGSRTNAGSPFNYEDMLNRAKKDKSDGKERNGIKRLRTRTIRWKIKKRKKRKRDEQNTAQGAEKVGSSVKKYAKGRGKKEVARAGKALYKFRETRGWTRPISNGSTHYDNCIHRIYKTKQKTWSWEREQRSVTTICLRESRKRRRKWGAKENYCEMSFHLVNIREFWCAGHFDNWPIYQPHVC